MYRKPVIDTNDIFRALADPVRRDLLGDLNDAPKSVRALAAPRHISRPAVSRHLAVLRECGVVACRQAGKENIYYLVPEPLREVREWLGQFWSTRLDALKTISEGEQND